MFFNVKIKCNYQFNPFVLCASCFPLSVFVYFRYLPNTDCVLLQVRPISSILMLYNSVVNITFFDKYLNVHLLYAFLYILLVLVVNYFVLSSVCLPISLRFIFFFFAACTSIKIILNGFGNDLLQFFTFLILISTTITLGISNSQS